MKSEDKVSSLGAVNATFDRAHCQVWNSVLACLRNLWLRPLRGFGRGRSRWNRNDAACADFDCAMLVVEHHARSATVD